MTARHLTARRPRARRISSERGSHAFRSSPTIPRAINFSSRYDRAAVFFFSRENQIRASRILALSPARNLLSSLLSRDVSKPRGSCAV